jgi:hypothetical protein
MLHWLKSCENFAIVGLNILKAYEDKLAYAMCIFPWLLDQERKKSPLWEKTTVKFYIQTMEFSYQLLVKLNAFVWKSVQIMITTLMSLF